MKLQAFLAVIFLSSVASHCEVIYFYLGSSVRSWSSEIAMHPSGRGLYVSVRGHNLISIFSVNKDGKLSWQTNAPVGVMMPRGFAIDPSGRWLLVGRGMTIMWRAAHRSCHRRPKPGELCRSQRSDVRGIHAQGEMMPAPQLSC